MQRYEHVRDEANKRARTILGKGSFGVTFLMREKATGRMLAVKQLKCPDTEAANTAIEEATTLIKLQHAGVLVCEKVFLGGESEEGDQLVYLVTRFCDGGDLDHVAAQLTPDERELAGRAFLEALQFTFSQNIIHRDLKPANILFYIEAGVRRLVIADFGLARPVDEGRTMTLRTGTPLFNAPELDAQMRYGLKADVFSAGLVMYCLFGAVSTSEFAQSLGGQLAADMCRDNWGDFEAMVRSRLGSRGVRPEIIDGILSMCNADPELRPLPGALLSSMFGVSVSAAPAPTAAAAPMGMGMMPGMMAGWQMPMMMMTPQGPVMVTPQGQQIPMAMNAQGQWVPMAGAVATPMMMGGMGVPTGMGAMPASAASVPAMPITAASATGLPASAQTMPAAPNPMANSMPFMPVAQSNGGISPAASATPQPGVPIAVSMPPPPPPSASSQTGSINSASSRKPTPPSTPPPAVVMPPSPPATPSRPGTAAAPARPGSATGGKSTLAIGQLRTDLEHTGHSHYSILFDIVNQSPSLMAIKRLSFGREGDKSEVAVRIFATRDHQMGGQAAQRGSLANWDLIAEEVRDFKDFPGGRERLQMFLMRQPVILGPGETVGIQILTSDNCGVTFGSDDVEEGLLVAENNDMRILAGPYGDSRTPLSFCQGHCRRPVLVVDYEMGALLNQTKELCAAQLVSPLERTGHSQCALSMTVANASHGPVILKRIHMAREDDHEATRVKIYATKHHRSSVEDVRAPIDWELICEEVRDFRDYKEGRERLQDFALRNPLLLNEGEKVGLWIQTPDHSGIMFGADNVPAGTVAMEDAVLTVTAGPYSSSVEPFGERGACRKPTGFIIDYECPPQALRTIPSGLTDGQLESDLTAARHSHFGYGTTLRNVSTGVVVLRSIMMARQNNRAGVNVKIFTSRSRLVDCAASADLTMWELQANQTCDMQDYTGGRDHMQTLALSSPVRLSPGQYVGIWVQTDDNCGVIFGEDAEIGAVAYENGVMQVMVGPYGKSEEPLADRSASGQKPAGMVFCYSSAVPTPVALPAAAPAAAAAAISPASGVAGQLESDMGVTAHSQHGLAMTVKNICSAPVTLTNVTFARQHDRNTAVKIYVSRSHNAAPSGTLSSSDYECLCDVTRTGFVSFTGQRSQLQSFPLSRPITLSPRESVGLYIHTGDNCGVMFGESDVSFGTSACRNHALEILAGPYTASATPFEQAASVARKPTGLILDFIGPPGPAGSAASGAPCQLYSTTLEATTRSQYGYCFEVRNRGGAQVQLRKVAFAREGQREGVRVKIFATMSRNRGSDSDSSSDWELVCEETRSFTPAYSGGRNNLQVFALNKALALGPGERIGLWIHTSDNCGVMFTGDTVGENTLAGSEGSLELYAGNYCSDSTPLTGRQERRKPTALMVEFTDPSGPAASAVAIAPVSAAGVQTLTTNLTETDRSQFGLSWELHNGGGTPVTVTRVGFAREGGREGVTVKIYATSSHSTSIEDATRADQWTQLHQESRNFRAYRGGHDNIESFALTTPLVLGAGERVGMCVHTSDNCGVMFMAESPSAGTVVARQGPLEMICGYYTGNATPLIDRQERRRPTGMLIDFVNGAVATGAASSGAPAQLCTPLLKTGHSQYSIAFDVANTGSGAATLRGLRFPHDGDRSGVAVKIFVTNDHHTTARAVGTSSSAWQQVVDESRDFLGYEGNGQDRLQSFNFPSPVVLAPGEIIGVWIQTSDNCGVMFGAEEKPNDFLVASDRQLTIYAGPYGANSTPFSSIQANRAPLVVLDYVGGASEASAGGACSQLCTTLQATTHSQYSIAFDLANTSSGPVTVRGLRFPRERDRSGVAVKIYVTNDHHTTARSVGTTASAWRQVVSESRDFQNYEGHGQDRLELFNFSSPVVLGAGEKIGVWIQTSDNCGVMFGADAKINGEVVARDSALALSVGPFGGNGEAFNSIAEANRAPIVVIEYASGGAAIPALAGGGAGVAGQLCCHLEATGHSHCSLAFDVRNTSGAIVVLRGLKFPRQHDRSGVNVRIFVTRAHNATARDAGLNASAWQQVVGETRDFLEYQGHAQDRLQSFNFSSPVVLAVGEKIGVWIQTSDNCGIMFGGSSRPTDSVSATDSALTILPGPYGTNSDPFQTWDLQSNRDPIVVLDYFKYAGDALSAPLAAGASGQLCCHLEATGHSQYSLAFDVRNTSGGSVTLRGLKFPRQRDQTGVAVKIYVTRDHHTTSRGAGLNASAWQQVVSETRDFQSYEGHAQDRLQSFVFSTPVTLAVGESIGVWMQTSDNCGVMFGADARSNDTISASDSVLTILAGPYGTSSEPFRSMEANRDPIVVLDYGSGASGSSTQLCCHLDATSHSHYSLAFDVANTCASAVTLNGLRFPRQNDHSGVVVKIFVTRDHHTTSRGAGLNASAWEQVAYETRDFQNYEGHGQERLQQFNFTSPVVLAPGEKIGVWLQTSDNCGVMFGADARSNDTISASDSVLTILAGPYGTSSEPFRSMEANRDPIVVLDYGSGAGGSSTQLCCHLDATSHSHYSLAFDVANTCASAVTLNGLKFPRQNDRSGVVVKIFVTRDHHTTARGAGLNASAWEQVAYETRDFQNYEGHGQERLQQFNFTSPVVLGPGEKIGVWLQTSDNCGVMFGAETRPNDTLSASDAALSIYASGYATNSEPFRSLEGNRDPIVVLDYAMGGVVAPAVPAGAEGQLCCNLAATSHSQYSLAFDLANTSSAPAALRGLKFPRCNDRTGVNVKIFVTRDHHTTSREVGLNSSAWQQVASETRDFQNYEGHGHDRLQRFAFTSPVVMGAGEKIGVWLQTSDNCGVMFGATTRDNNTVSGSDSVFTVYAGGYGTNSEPFQSLEGNRDPIVVLEYVRGGSLAAAPAAGGDSQLCCHLDATSHSHYSLAFDVANTSSATVTLRGLKFPRQNDRTGVNVKIYVTRDHRTTSRAAGLNAAAWSTVASETRDFQNYEGHGQERLQRFNFPSPVVLAPGDKIGVWLQTSDNCGVMFGAETRPNDTLSASDGFLSIFVGGYGTNSEPFHSLEGNRDPIVVLDYAVGGAAAAPRASTPSVGELASDLAATGHSQHGLAMTVRNVSRGEIAIKRVAFAREKDRSDVNVKIFFTRQHNTAIDFNPANWECLVEERRSFENYQGGRERIQAFALRTPVRLGPGHYAGMYIHTSDNCGITFGATGCPIVSPACSNGTLEILAGPYSQNETPFQGLSTEGRKPTGMLVEYDVTSPASAGMVVVTQGPVRQLASPDMVTTDRSQYGYAFDLRNTGSKLAIVQKIHFARENDRSNVTVKIFATRAHARGVDGASDPSQWDCLCEEVRSFHGYRGGRNNIEAFQLRTPIVVQQGERVGVWIHTSDNCGIVFMAGEVPADTVVATEASLQLIAGPYSGDATPLAGHNERRKPCGLIVEYTEGVPAGAASAAPSAGSPGQTARLWSAKLTKTGHSQYSYCFDLRNVCSRNMILQRIGFAREGDKADVDVQIFVTNNHRTNVASATSTSEWSLVTRTRRTFRAYNGGQTNIEPFVIESAVRLAPGESVGVWLQTSDNCGITFGENDLSSAEISCSDACLELKGGFWGGSVTPLVDRKGRRHPTGLFVEYAPLS